MAGSESDITNMNLAMNPVMTRKEKPRDYNVGFELTEENLRRIYGVAITRMREATNLEETKLYIKYKVKYRDNLEIHDFLTIDQIISEPGNQEIQSLEIIIGRSQSELPQIVLKFIKPDRLGQTSIKSIASGENRDWVEITIDNSINSAIRSIKRSPFALILVKPFVLALTIVMLIIAFLYDGVSMYFYSNTNI